MKKIEDNEQVRIMLSKDALKQVDRFVEKIPNMKRAQLISNLVLMGLDDVKFLDNLGLLRAARVARAMVEGAAAAFKQEDLISEK